MQEDAAREDDAEALDIPAGAPIIRLLRIRYGDDHPMVVSANVVHRDALPGPVAHRDWGGSLTAALEAHGQQIKSSVATISAVNLPPEIEKRYNLAGLGPWLLVNEIGLTRDGRRVLFAKDYHRGDEISFSVIRRS